MNNSITVCYNDKKTIQKNRECVSLALDKARESARATMANSEKAHVLYGIMGHDEEDNLSIVYLYQPALELTDKELDEFIIKYPRSIFHCFHTGTHKKACCRLEEKRKSREIRNIHLKDANAFVNQYHRHHKGSTGCKFALGMFEEDKLIGVAICGRPVSRHLDDGRTMEIYRVCTKGGPNICSALYSRCCQICKLYGNKKVITYILESENGASLKASNFVCEGKAGGTHWTGERNRGQNIPNEMKLRYARNLD